MSGGSLDYVSYRIGEAAAIIQRELANMKLRYDNGKYAHVGDYARKEHPDAKELADDKTFTEAIIKQLGKALVCMRNAEIYAHEFEWWTSGDTGSDDFLFTTLREVKGNKEARGIV